MASKSPNRGSRILAAISLRRMRLNRRAAMGGEDIGFALAVLGGFIAVATIVGIFFVPVATFTTFDQELGAAIGVVLLVLGLGVKWASE